MKQLTLFTTMLLFSLNANAIETDKAAHFGLSYVGTDMCIKLTDKKWTCAGLVLLAGAIKESRDKESRNEHKSDMKANLSGIAVNLITWEWKF